MQPDADHELIAEFLSRRDERVFRELYRRHTPALYLLALRVLGGCTPDAEDAIQEVWLRAARSLDLFRGGSSLRTWLCGIAVNCCRELQRKRGHEAAEEAMDEVSCAPSEARVDLELLIRRLPNACREVFVLHDVEGYTHEEIGAMTGIAAGTSKHQLFRAREKLREWLAARPAGEGKNYNGTE